MQDNSPTHLILIGLLMIIAVNLFVLDLKVFTPSSIQLSDVSTVNTSPTPLISPISSNLSNLSCPASCLSAIQQATTSAGLGSNLLQGRAFQTASGQSRETYIPLGSGSTSKSNWDDLTATETVIDPGNYGNIKEAYFIASLRNPTQNGQAEAQLYNVTDKHPVWGSQVTMNGPSSQTITSGKITLDNGTKLYRVQLKSTLSYQAFLDNAKIRIMYE
ncbi:hypothetical protein HZB96_01135 [Candidatus Gottesmanbacteria bacterium]|nr:hypothetical protein [Candidatus Gottesmanbacteria bacterium]